MAGVCLAAAWALPGPINQPHDPVAVDGGEGVHSRQELVTG